MTSGPSILRGRRREWATLDGLIEAARGGRSSVVVVLGEPGIGKSALLKHVEAAAGCRVLRVAGVESEMELAYAGLNELLSPLVPEIERLPPPMADALRSALGMAAGSSPDRLQVGLAALTLLAQGAQDQPLLCLVDDAQWLDHASVQTLTFVARRLQAESVVLVIAARTAAGEDGWEGLPKLVLQGLPQSDALALLKSALPRDLDPRVRERLLGETRGNPLALLELPHWFGAAELTFGPELVVSKPPTTRVEDGFARQLQLLPEQCRQLLLVAATEPLGDVGMLRDACERLGIGMDAAIPAEEAGLLTVLDKVWFRHPLLRSVSYRSAPLEHRRLVHGILADLTDPQLDPDRRAWHRAQSVVGPDESVAAELERSAGRALAQGGLAAASAFLERAAFLTADPSERVRRQLDRADIDLRAGSLDAALQTLAMAMAENATVTDVQHARVDVLRARIGFASRRGSEALPVLLAAARRLESLDVQLALDSYVDALTATLFAGRFASYPSPSEVGQAASRATTLAEPRRRDLLLKAVAVRYSDGYPAAVPLLRTAAAAFDTHELTLEDAVRFMWLAAVVASDLWEERLWDRLTERHLAIVRRAGALSALPLALSTRVYVHLFEGDLAAASALVDQVRDISSAAGIAQTPYDAIGLAAFRGDRDHAAPLIQSAARDVAAHGDGIGFTLTHWAWALVCNGLGRYVEALDAAHVAAAHPGDVGLNGWALVEQVEAGVRAGEPATATDALAQLSTLTSASGTDWALGVHARCGAQLQEGRHAEALYQEAVERLESTKLGFEAARAQLLYGEWLRREGRRREARDRLRTAHLALSDMGANAFSERARRELAATGEASRQPAPGKPQRLTAQELRIARLAAEGITNADIATELFISPRTVEWHLRNVFGTLGITARQQLRSALQAARD